jgi:uncharacterized protein Yka (UPF0111/DUF47 family)
MPISDLFRNKQDSRFIALLIEQAEKTVEGITVLESWLSRPGLEAIEQVKVKEREADEVRRIIIDELHNTFITPIDREDIFNLSLSIDEMLDYGLTTVEGMHLLKVDADEHLVKMVGLVRLEAEEIALATKRLRENPRVAGDHARRAKKLESEVDHMYRVAVADLFEKVEDIKQLTAVFRRREVYRHVSNMSDRADVAANIFGMVVMKLT